MNSRQKKEKIFRYSKNFGELCGGKVGTGVELSSKKKILRYSKNTLVSCVSRKEYICKLLVECKLLL
jgi:hypothetical protein